MSPRWEPAGTKKPVAGRDLYDEPAFFARYQRMRAAGQGLNAELEQPSLTRMLPPVRDRDVVDLGCGDGTQARRLAEAGARSVLAVDSATRMLERAARYPHRSVRYLRADIEALDLPGRGTDLVVSSLALHYVADYRGLLARVGRWLRPGGHLVFSVEHPICTAHDPMTGWQGDLWPVDHYDQETARVQSWFGTPVIKHHRRLTTLVGAILAAGLDLVDLDEPQPDARALARRPDLAQYTRRPPLLVISATKRAGFDPAGPRPVTMGEGSVPGSTGTGTRTHN